ncbi:MAG: glycosyltransferase [Candidatus Gottesmanbacteria bacterium]
MRVAIVHDYIKEYGGAERVLEALHELFPEAPVFTSVYCPNFLGPHKQRFATWNIRTSWLQHIPLKEKLISPLRLFAPSIFAHMDFSDFDVVIVSATGAYQSNMIQKGNAVHICYCHTPPRYLYGYATARNWKKNPLVRVFGEIANHFLRNIDFQASQHVDYFIANSKEVASRIKKFYRKQATVIYPPVDIPTNTAKVKKSDYFLTGGRLAQAKHIDLAIAACSTLKVPLKVFGKGFAGHGEELKKSAGPTIEFIGEVTDQKKWTLMKEAKAFIFPSEDEDFGILPVEAMAAGTPIIAHRSGGVIETVVEGKTGMFFNMLSKESLINTIKKFVKENKNWTVPCKKQAALFTKTIFKKQITSFLATKITEKLVV